MNRIHKSIDIMLQTDGWHPKRVLSQALKTWECLSDPVEPGPYRARDTVAILDFKSS